MVFMTPSITRGPPVETFSSLFNLPKQSSIITLAQKTLQAGLDKVTNYRLTSKNITQTTLAIASIVSYVFHGTIAATIGSLAASILPFSLIMAAGLITFQSYSTPALDPPLTQEQVTELFMNEVAEIKTIPDLVACHQAYETFLKRTKSECRVPAPKEIMENTFNNLSLNEIQRFNREKENLEKAPSTQANSQIYKLILKSSLAHQERVHRTNMAYIQKNKKHTLEQLDIFSKENASRN